jgi:hypothetical protein
MAASFDAASNPRPVALPRRLDYRIALELGEAKPPPFGEELIDPLLLVLCRISPRCQLLAHVLLARLPSLANICDDVVDLEDVFFNYGVKYSNQ